MKYDLFFISLFLIMGILIVIMNIVHWLDNLPHEEEYPQYTNLDRSDFEPDYPIPDFNDPSEY